MIYNYNEIKDKLGSDYQIKKAISNGMIYKLESGLYSDQESIHYLDIFTKKNPKAIISGDSAYYYHNLTDVIPKKIYMTTDRNSGRFKDNNIEQSYAIDNYFSLGKTTIEYEGVKINIYDKERLLLEIIKNKNNTPYDYYKEIINNYRKIRNNLDIMKLHNYSTVYPNGEKFMEMIQDEVF